MPRLEALLTLGVVGFGVASVGAQEQTAAIEGRVRDALGAAAPGVVVAATSVAGLSLEQTTDGAGAYRWSALPPGRYELRARLSGFQPVAVTGIDLRLGQRLSIDLTLRPAGPDETVEVTSESPLVAITQSARATSLRGDEIEKMPRGRDFTSLATQAAGVCCLSRNLLTEFSRFSAGPRGTDLGFGRRGL